MRSGYASNLRAESAFEEDLVLLFIIYMQLRPPAQAGQFMASSVHTEIFPKSFKKSEKCVRGAKAQNLAILGRGATLRRGGVHPLLSMGARAYDATLYARSHREWVGYFGRTEFVAEWRHFSHGPAGRFPEAGGGAQAGV